MVLYLICGLLAGITYLLFRILEEMRKDKK